MLTNTKKLLLSTLLSLPLLFSACNTDITDALKFTAHYSTAVGSMSFDNNATSEVVSSSNSGGQVQTYNDTSVDFTLGTTLSYGDHLILTNTAGTVTLELSPDCQSIIAFTYTDTSTNITYNDFSGITNYQCTTGAPVTATINGYSGTTTPHDITFDGSLTNTTNDVVQVTNASVGIVEFYYQYDLLSNI
ncbi:hypothetical protein [Sulfurimonas sp.]